MPGSFLEFMLFIVLFAVAALLGAWVMSLMKKGQGSNTVNKEVDENAIQERVNSAVSNVEQRYEKKVETLEKKLKDAASAPSDAQAAVADFDTSGFEKEIASLKTALEAEQSKVADLSSGSKDADLLSAKDEEINSLKSQLEELSKNASEALANQAGADDTLQKELAKLNNEMSTLKMSVQDKDAEIKRLKSSFQNTEATPASKETIPDGMSKTDFTIEMNNLHSKINNLKADVRTKDEEMQRLRGSRDVVQEQLGETKNQMMELKSTLQQLQNAASVSVQAKDPSEEMLELEAQLKDYKTKAFKAELKVESLQEKIEKLGGKVKKKQVS